MKKSIYILSIAVLTVFFIGCEAEKASQDPSPIGDTDSYPTPTFTFSSGELTTNEQNETVIIYDVLLDKPIDRPIDFSWVILGGDATEHDDFDLVSGSVPAYQTEAQISVLIHNDGLIEGTESLNLTIHSGPSLANTYLVNPDTVYPEVNIQIENYLGEDLEIGLEWAADNGSGATATELADLILLVTDAVTPYTNVVTSADGGDFENVIVAGDTPDGDYFILADVYALDASAFDVDLNVSVNQDGIINDLNFNFPSAFDSQIICSDYVVLAKITKSGTNYTVTSENAAIVNDGTPDMSSAAPFIGTATVVQDDWADYAVGESIVIEANPSDPNSFFIRAYTNPYITNGATAYMIVTLDPCGNATVVSNEDFDYGCSAGVVTGTGSVDPVAGTVNLVLNFDLGDCGAATGNVFSLQL